jgi:phosphonate transport system substrate-binding protein
MFPRPKYIVVFLPCLLLAAIIFYIFFPEASAEEIRAADDEKPLRLVIVPEKNTFEQLRRYRYITNFLSRKMDLDVTVEIMANYGEISDAFQEGRADAGFFGSFSYVLTHAKTGVEPIARPVWFDGSSTYRGYIFVRSDSNIRTVKDMKDKNLVLVDKATTAGYIFPLYYFKYSGIRDMEEFFSRISFARSHDAAAWAVYTGEADVGSAKNHIFNSFREQNPDFRERMIIIAESPAVPSNGLAVRKDLNPAIKVRLRNLLLELEKDPEGSEVLKNFGALRFIETTDDDYEVIYNMANELGIDLTEYSYQ